MHIVALEDLGHTFDVVVVDCKDWGFRILFLWSLENTCCQDNWTSPDWDVNPRISIFIPFEKARSRCAWDSL